MFEDVLMVSERLAGCVGSSNLDRIIWLIFWVRDAHTNLILKYGVLNKYSLCPLPRGVRGVLFFCDQARPFDFATPHTL